jgi:hypothetical protein
MKKLLFALVIVLISTSAFAQRGGYIDFPFPYNASNKIPFSYLDGFGTLTDTYLLSYSTASGIVATTAPYTLSGLGGLPWPEPAEYNSCGAGAASCTTTAVVVTVGTSAAPHKNQYMTLTDTDATPVSFTQPSGTAHIQIRTIQPASVTTGGTITWTGVLWPSGVPPTLTATANAVDILSFYLDGTHIYGSYTLDVR